MNINDKKNYLTLVQRVEKRGNTWYGLFKCDCGSEKVIRISAVSTGGTLSCGCHRQKVAINNGKSVTTHNLSKDPIYRVWTELKCNHSTELCDEWLDFINFYNWIKDVYKKGSSISRYDMNKPYCNTNCYLESRHLAKEKTNIIKYGSASPFSCKGVKDKIKKTNLEKYGVEVAAKSELVKNNTKANNRKKYGVDYPHQLPESRERFRKLTVDRGQAYTLDGKTTPQWAEELNISNSALIQRIHRYGFEKAITIESGVSSIEQDIASILSEATIEFETQYKVENKSADIFIPSHNLIIEADGLYWHSDAINKDKYYHRDKLRLYSAAGYTSLFFREDEIQNKLDIVKSIIFNKLSLSTKFFARKCSIEHIPKEMAKTFLNDNHLMGNGRGDSYALVYDNNILSIIQILIRKGVMEISRFCNRLNYSVTGGFSRLLAHVEKQYAHEKVGTFIDNRYGIGSYLYGMGFKKINEDISFVWVKNLETYHRLKYRGNSGYEYGMYKLWDCGQTRFEK